MLVTYTSNALGDLRKMILICSFIWETIHESFCAGLLCPAECQHFVQAVDFFYNPFKDCWLLPKDKLACLGFPVTPEISAAMSVPTVPIADHFHAASIAGNSFHFSTVAVVQMVALACYRIKA